MCMLGNSTHQRHSNAIRGQMWVRVYQEVRAQTRYITNPPSFCLPRAYLVIP